MRLRERTARVKVMETSYVIAVPPNDAPPLADSILPRAIQWSNSCCRTSFLRLIERLQCVAIPLLEINHLA